MFKEGAGTDYRGGEIYTTTLTLDSAGDDQLRFRFYFTDGKDDATGAPGAVDFAKERYSRSAGISGNPTAVTTATAVPTPGTDDSIDVSMAYSGDADANNSYSVRYCVQSACGSWTDHVVGAAHTASPYLTTITGLTPGETYQVQMSYVDDSDVSGVNPVVVADITLPFMATTAGTAAASARSLTSLMVSMPYSNDANANSYKVEYKLSSSGTWGTWAPDPQPHSSSPFTTAITGLTSAGTYDARMTYNDADGFIGGQAATQAVSNHSGR